MSISKHLVIPIKQCLSFAQDQFFKSARHTLEKSGIKWTELIESSQQDVNGKLVLPTMDTVFFHPDKFEILIDARGYKPEDLQCIMTPLTVEVRAQRQEQGNNTQRAMSMTRNYMLPRNVLPEQGNCCMSTEGILLITAPWMK